MNRRKFVLTSVGVSASAASGYTFAKKTFLKNETVPKLNTAWPALSGNASRISLKEHREELASRLYDEYLPFWDHGGYDKKYGGFICNLDKESRNPNLGVVYLTGAIMDSGEVLEKLHKMEKDKKIKGVLFIVDSPGGAVSPSIEIAYAVKRLSAKKPVVAYAVSTMASGSYYASIWADKIVANPGSLIGSIGVIFQSYNLKELVAKIGIKEQTVYAGKYKTVGTMMRDWKKHEKREIQTLINDTYQLFIKDVASARGLNINKHKDFADAHIFIAHKAKKVGLIDKVGTIYDAQNELARLSKVLDPRWQKNKKGDSIIDKMITESSNKIVNMLFGLKAF